MRNIVWRTPGISFTSSTAASVTHPLSNESVVTSLAVMNGMTIWTSSWVVGSYVSWTSFSTTDCETFSGSTRAKMLTISCRASASSDSWYGRYIIDRESPYTVNEKPAFAGGAACASVNDV